MRGWGGAGRGWRAVAGVAGGPGVRTAADGAEGGRRARLPRLLPAGSECALSASGGGPCAWRGRGSEGRGTGSRPCGYACGCSSSGGDCGRGTPSHRRSTSPSPRSQPPRRRLPATQHHSAAPPDTRLTTPTHVRLSYRLSNNGSTSCFLTYTACRYSSQGRPATTRHIP